jgi:hypothetical protein
MERYTKGTHTNSRDNNKTDTNIGPHIKMHNTRAAREVQNKEYVSNKRT